MADYDVLTYFHLTGTYDGIVGDTTGFFGDAGTNPDLYAVNMTATVALSLTDPATGKPIAGAPELRLTTPTPPRTLLLLPIDASVQSGVFRLPGADRGVDGVDLIAKSSALELAAGVKLLCTVTFGPTTIGGHTYQFDPVTFEAPTVNPSDYHANVVQQIQLTGSPAGGGWSPVYGQTPTATLPVNVTAAALQAALRAITAIGNAVTVTGGSGGVNCVQTVTVNGAPGTGNLTLQFLDETCGPIPVAASATVVGNTLKLLNKIGDLDVAVTGPNGGPWQITFQNGLGSGVIPLLIGRADTAMANAGGTIGVAMTTAGVNPGPFTATFDTALIPRPQRFGKIDNLFGGASPSVQVTDNYVPVTVDLTTVARYVAA
jgi:hypothetical protein